MICEAGEKLTQEELLQRATREAAKELPPLEEKDLVKVTERKSLRVLKLERTVEHGVEEIYVHYQRVRKIGDNPWIPDGKVIKDSPLGFEMGGLLYYHVEHEMAALTVFALAETAVFGAVMIIELGIATLGQLLFFVSVQVVVYRFTTDVEDRTLEGYLTAVLKGELDAVGFKFLAGVTKGLGGFVAGKIVARELVSEVATKWIVFGLRGVVTATGVGAMEATYLFAQDLLTYSRCKGWSNPSKYWERFAYGFAFTLGFEFLGVPLLSPPLRLLLERAADSRAVARVLRAIGKSLPEITDAVIEGSEKVNAALARTAEHEAVPVIAQSLRERVADVLKALGREYESRAYRSLLELYGPELGAEATQGLQRLLKTASEGEIDAVLQRLLARKTSPAELLRALGKADEALIADLVKTGQLAELGVSRRLLALLTQDPDIGVQLLRGPFKSVVGDLERFLGRLEPLPPDAQQSILGALAREKPLQPEILLAAAKQVGILDEPTLGLLEKLRDSKVRVSALFDGSGPSLKEFADDFAKLPQAERAATLENAAGRTPAQLLKQAKLPAKPPDAPKPPPKPPQAPPPAPAERTLAEIERGLQSKGLTRGELRKFVRPTQRMTARVARQVARLLDHFTLDEVRKFADFHSRHGLALDEYTVDLFVDEVARGKLDEMLSKLEHLHAHGEATGAAEWSAEKFAAEADLTVHPGKPPPLSEFVETPGSSVLRASLIERAGEPPPGYHAHHIIPEKQFGPGLDWLRDRLANAGSGINKANNGVFLAGSKSTANPELTRLHNSYIHAGSSNEYAYTLTRRLADKQGAEFLTEVEKIGEEMAKGKFNILEIPRGWKTKWKPGMTAPIEPKVEPVWIDE